MKKRILKLIAEERKRLMRWINNCERRPELKRVEERYRKKLARLEKDEQALIRKLDRP